MTRGLFAALLSLFVGGTAAASPIRYDQIPAEVSGFFHVDFDQFFSSHIAHQPDAAKLPEQIRTAFGGDIADLTMYSFLETDDASRVGITIHARGFDLRKQFEAKAAGAKDAVEFTYEKHTVHYLADGLQTLFSPQVNRTGQPGRAEGQHSYGYGPEPRTTFTLGLGTGKGDPLNGPSYVSFIGPDLLVLDGNIRSMADTLDVLDGRKPSLKKLDPKGLKFDVAQGAFALGAGIRASLQGEEAKKAPAGHAADPPQPTVREPGGGFVFNFLGSFEGKATLGRFDMGEDAQAEYIHASIRMIDPESAEQFKNMILGLKALVSFSDATQKPLIAPLDVRAAGRDVILQWSWQTDKVSDLLRLLHTEPDHDRSTEAPTSTTQPAR